MTIVNMNSPKPRITAAVIIGSCVIASLFIWPSFLSSTAKEGTLGRIFQRELRSEGKNGDSSDPDSDAVYPWAMKNIRPHKRIPEPEKETALYWHIPKSGGTTAKSFYRCLGKRINIQSREADIQRSEGRGLISSGQVDIIFSSNPRYAIERLYDPMHRTSVLTMFRHPVDRLISEFYYRQVASWELSFQPEWADMDILEWAKSHNSDNNHMVNKLAGNVEGANATDTDLLRAKRTVRRRFIVGLMEEMKESIRRFNIVMGINDKTDESHERCMTKFFGNGIHHENSNPHPKVEEGHPAWDLLAEKNALDIALYEFVLKIFEEQRGMIDFYAGSIVMAPV